ncbi:LysR family transcriptional regulator [Rhodovulum sulfidophilum]|uniref:LysR family transcriptional regulator n=1 Tax=Rhodovulum sulfidophilum TaxID=35806 RepID=UPI0019249233|nr:LysR substrate-binding domain-containing protein [Rhodovulum sulfidophilum]MBL3596140.1 LysR family transcriptional regulator [Rhodovulum sulfidophilum]
MTQGLDLDEPDISGMGMDLRQLRYFLEIVERGSITGAAATLNVAQPALSLHVRNLEARLGTRLLLRRPTGVVPTEAGEILARRARSILAEVARTEAEIRGLETDPSGRVVIGLTGTIGGLLAVPLIEALRERYPQITLQIAEAMSGFVAGWLSEGRVDLAVLYEAPADPGLACDPLLEEELVVLWPPDWTAPPEIGMVALDGVPLVLPSRAHGLRRMIDAELAGDGIAPELAVEIDSYSNIKNLVAAGFGASVLPWHAVAPEAEAGRLVVSRIVAPGLWRGAWLIRPGARPVTRAQEAVAETLRMVVDDLLARGVWAAARAPGTAPSSGGSPTEADS